MRAAAASPVGVPHESGSDSSAGHRKTIPALVPPAPSHPRRKKLVLPGLQLRLAGLFVLTATLAMWIEFLVLRARTRIALESMDGGAALADGLDLTLTEVMGFTLAILLPLVLTAAIVASSRIAGPAWRLEAYLRSILAGKDPGPCAIRRGDELKSLFVAINDTAAELRAARRDERVREAS